MQETALLLINFQSARAEEGSEYTIDSYPTLTLKAEALLDHARSMGYKIIFIKNIESDGAFSKGNPLSELLPEFTPQPGEIVIEKHKISSYYQTNLDQELKGVKNLIIAGVLSNLCVRMCIEESYDREFRIAVIDDACGAFLPEIQETTREDLYGARPDLNILTLREFIN